MDNLFRYAIYGITSIFLVVAMVSCISCTGKTSLVSEMASDCKHGPRKSSVKEHGNKKETVVECAGYGL